jgi:hypothetical protein
LVIAKGFGNDFFAEALATMPSVQAQTSATASTSLEVIPPRTNRSPAFSPIFIVMNLPKERSTYAQTARAAQEHFFWPQWLAREVGVCDKRV